MKETFFIKKCDLRKLTIYSSQLFHTQWSRKLGWVFFSQFCDVTTTLAIIHKKN